jgi:hypothetical protein
MITSRHTPIASEMHENVRPFRRISTMAAISFSHSVTRFLRGRQFAGVRSVHRGSLATYAFARPAI